MNERRIELPWAYAKRPGFKGETPGLYFFYFRTRGEAQKSVKFCERKKIWHGQVEYRPNECHAISG
jgi:hypothetical protein